MKSQNQKIKIGDYFPQISGETLSGKEIIFPDSVSGKITLICIAFERQTQAKMDAWLNPFIEKYASDPLVDFYELPMLKNRWKVIAPIIDGGMRGGVPLEKHDHVATYYGNLTKYTDPLDLADESDGYAFLIDQTGKIQWRAKGWPDKGHFDDLDSLISDLKMDNSE